MEYRAGGGWDFNGSNDGDGVPDILTSHTIILERNSGLAISRPMTFNADRVELSSDANVFITADLLGSIGALTVTARGTRPVHALAYNEATGQMEWVDQPAGNINIQTSQFTAPAWELRASGDIYLESPTAMTLTGFVGGLTGTDRAATVTVKTPEVLSLVKAKVSANTVQLEAQSINADFRSQILAGRLDVQATSSISLRTAVDAITAVSTAGNITLANVGDVVLQRVIAANGAITAASSGNLTALDVETLTDAAGNDVNLLAVGNLYVNYVDAGRSGGISRQYSRATLDAAGTIREPAGYVDNVAQEGATMTDVIAWQIKLLHGQPIPAPVLVGQGSRVGSGDELELLYIDPAGLEDGPSTTGTVPSVVDGDYVLVAPNYHGNVNLTVTGTLLVLLLPTFDGQIIELTAQGDLEIVDDLTTGSGTVTLTTGGALTVERPITAGFLSVTADSLTRPLVTDVGTLSFEITRRRREFHRAGDQCTDRRLRTAQRWRPGD